MGDSYEEKLRALKHYYLPRNIKLRVKERVVVIIPPDTHSETKEIILPAGVEVTLLDLEGTIHVATKTHGIKDGILIRVYKGPQNSNEFDAGLINKEVVVPGDILEIHPDEL